MRHVYIILSLTETPPVIRSAAERYLQAKETLTQMPDGPYKIVKQLVSLRRAVYVAYSDFIVKEGVVSYDYRNSVDDLEAQHSGKRAA